MTNTKVCRGSLSSLVRAAKVFAVAVIAGAFFVAGPFSAAASAGSSVEMGMGGLVNQARQENGRGQLSFNDRVADMARAWSERMAQDGTLSHNPNRSAMVAGIFGGRRASGENVAVAGSMEHAHRLLLESAPHFANIVGDYNVIGIGIVSTPNAVWVTQVFVRNVTAAAPAQVQPAARPASAPATQAAARPRTAPKAAPRPVKVRAVAEPVAPTAAPQVTAPPQSAPVVEVSDEALVARGSTTAVLAARDTRRERSLPMAAAAGLALLTTVTVLRGRRARRI